MRYAYNWGVRKAVFSTWWQSSFERTKAAPVILDPSLLCFHFPASEWFVWSSFCEDKPESAAKNQALGRGMPSEVAACHSWYEIFPHETWELCMLVFCRWRSFQSSRTMETWFLDFFGFYCRSNNLDWYRILYIYIYMVIPDHQKTNSAMWISINSWSLYLYSRVPILGRSVE